MMEKKDKYVLSSKYDKYFIHAPLIVYGENCYFGDYCSFEGNIQIDAHVIIGDRVTIKGNVTIGEGTVIGDNAVIVGNVRIGKNCKISAAYIGGAAEMYATGQDPRYTSGRVEIGDNCVIREFVTIHSSSKDVTKIGNCVFLMVHSHVGHDAVIENDVTVSPTSCIGGFTRVMQGSYVGMQATIHQNTTVGAYAMVGMNAAVVKDVPPFFTVVGSPARFLKINERGMLRHGFSMEEITAMKSFSFDVVNTKYSHLRVYYHEFDQKRNHAREQLTRGDVS